MLLRHESNKVRIAAGQTLAMLFEINGETTTGGKSGGDEEGPQKLKQRLQHSFYGWKQHWGSFDGEEALKQAIQAEETLSVEDVVELVEDLAGEYDRSKGKKKGRSNVVYFGTLLLPYRIAIIQSCA